MENQMKEENQTKMEDQGKKKRNRIIICILLVLVIALIGTIIYLLTRKDEDGLYVIDKDNYTQIKDEMDDKVKEGYFETYMTTEWVFPDGASEATDALLGNSPNNRKPIRCEILLKDTGEKVLSTRVIPVGSELPSIKLDVDLDKGTYEAICMVYLLDETEEGTYTEYSNAGFDVTITIQN